MTEAWVGLLLSAVLASPSPQPGLKTIVTVHSSPFCSTLTTSVKPALFGLMRNDQQGSATWSPSSGDTTMLSDRQRQIAVPLEHNIETIDKILANPKQFAAAHNGDEQAALAAIKTQLNAGKRYCTDIRRECQAGTVVNAKGDDDLHGMRRNRRRRTRRRGTDEKVEALALRRPLDGARTRSRFTIGA